MTSTLKLAAAAATLSVLAIATIVATRERPCEERLSGDSAVSPAPAAIGASAEAPAKGFSEYDLLGAMEEAEDEARAAAIGEALKKFDEQSKDIMRSLPPEKVYDMKVAVQKIWLYYAEMRPDLLGDAQSTSEKQFAILQKLDGMNAYDIMKMAETAPGLRDIKLHIIDSDAAVMGPDGREEKITAVERKLGDLTPEEEERVKLTRKRMTEESRMSLK